MLLLHSVKIGLLTLVVCSSHMAGCMGKQESTHVRGSRGAHDPKSLPHPADGRRALTVLTSTPTGAPEAGPTLAPSLSPSTTSPTPAPTSALTPTPSSAPSTTALTYPPTSAPTTAEPSGVPSTEPTGTPTGTPTILPSFTPTIGTSPSSAPSAACPTGSGTRRMLLGLDKCVDCCEGLIRDKCAEFRREERTCQRACKKDSECKRLCSDQARADSKRARDDCLDTAAPCQRLTSLELSSAKTSLLQYCRRQ